MTADRLDAPGDTTAKLSSQVIKLEARRWSARPPLRSVPYGSVCVLCQSVAFEPLTCDCLRRLLSE